MVCSSLGRLEAVLIKLVRLWTLVGVALLFGFAIYRLGSRGIATVVEGLTPAEWTILSASTILFVYGEGVRALQKKWIPQVIARAHALSPGRGPILYLLAPLYGMALVGSRPRALLRAWATTFAIALAAYLVSRMPEPWRGIVDLSVSAALGWGLLFIVGGILAEAGLVRPGPERNVAPR